MLAGSCEHVRVLAAIRGAVLDAWAVLMPVECAGCGAPDRAICAECAGRIRADVTPRSLPHGLTVFTALRYEHEVRRMVIAMKEQNRTDVARALAVPLARAVARGLELGAGGRAPVEVLAVPSSRAAFRARGYDPVALMLRSGGTRPTRALVPARSTARQKTLALDERAANSRNSMRARGQLNGRRFLIVDDVLTSGATIAEAVRATTAAGGEVVGAAALAFTPRLSASS